MSQMLGQIITFYSYKGGVGRTMSLANLAVLLARRGNRVLAIDWDLEAPGLERYFEPYMGQISGGGLIDFLISAAQLPLMPEDEEDEDMLNSFYKQLRQYILPVSKLPVSGGSIDLLRAGDTTAPDYADKILSFNWLEFFNKIPGFFPHLAYFLKQQYDFVLIDSRTGHTDAGGVCTMLLPDALVLVFIPNNQNLTGVIALAEKASNYRKQSGDVRPLRLFPLPSRIELQEKEEREKWYGKYQQAFEETFKKIFNLPPISMTRYFDETLIRQDTYFAYGEKIAALDEKVTNNISLTKAYNDFLEQLTGTHPIWDFTENHDSRDDKSGKVLIVYASKDKILYDKISHHLTPLKNKVKEWQNFALPNRMDEQTKRQLSIHVTGADVIILLFSADFLSMDTSILQNGIKDKPKIGIVGRPCLWDYYAEGPGWQIFPEKSLSLIEQDEIGQAKTAREISTAIQHIITSTQAAIHEQPS
jgi:hypothetical protein